MCGGSTVYVILTEVQYNTFYPSSDLIVLVSTDSLLTYVSTIIVENFKSLLWLQQKV